MGAWTADRRVLLLHIGNARQEDRALQECNPSAWLARELPCAFTRASGWFSCWRSLLNASAITAQSEKLIVQFFDEVAPLTFLAGVPLQGFDWLQSSLAFVPNA